MIPFIKNILTEILSLIGATVASVGHLLPYEVDPLMESPREFPAVGSFRKYSNFMLNFQTKTRDLLTQEDFKDRLGTQPSSYSGKLWAFYDVETSTHNGYVGYPTTLETGGRLPYRVRSWDLFKDWVPHGTTTRTFSSFPGGWEYPKSGIRTLFSARMANNTVFTMWASNADALPYQEDWQDAIS